MATCLVTGVAGFIGSHLAGRLLGRGHTVIGVDCFTRFYERSKKDANLRDLLGQPEFRMQTIDLAAAPPDGLPSSIDYVFHLAAQPGVRASWGHAFAEYARNNVLGTQRLLEALTAIRPRRVIVASSSSVYGSNAQWPISETAEMNPASPYGVTKLAAEKLCLAYAKAFDIDVCILRYFSVYGPRQRPDMVFHRFLRAALLGEKLSVYGDGTQRRDFTYVDDVVEATLSAMESDAPNAVFNIGSGRPYDLRSCIEIIQGLCPRPLAIEYSNPEIGDRVCTWADINRARHGLSYAPRCSIQDGLARQWEWMQQVYGG